MGRETGELVDWNDMRGFGFIRPAQGEHYFVHISAIDRIATRPHIGDSVSFEPGPWLGWPAHREKRQDRRGQSGARPGHSPARSPPAPAAPRRRPSAAAALLTGLLLAAVSIGHLPPMVALIYVAAGVISIFFYRADKSSAQAGEWRVSESTLLGIDLCCGIIGGLLAQHLFRHKTVKPSFVAATGLIAAVHALWLGGLAAGFISVAELIALLL